MAHVHSLSKRDGSRNHVSVDIALQKFLFHPALSKSVLASEYVNLAESLDRVLATNLESPFDIPPFSRSTMDGFAVLAGNTTGASKNNPVSLNIAGKISAGENISHKVESGNAIEIATGAKIPDGADSVIMVEDTVSENNNKVRLVREIQKGTNITLKGEDLKKGQILLEQGKWLSAQDVGLIASVGIDKVPVFRKVKVAVFSTGNELAEPGSKLDSAKIFDSNRFMISCMIKNFGGQPVDLGICKDERDAIEYKLAEALNFDIVLVTGGSSVGEKDFVPDIINTHGEPGVIIRGVAMKPGSPTSLAIVDGKPIIVAPGYPVSAFMAFYTFGQPLLFQFLKTEGYPVARVTAKMASSVRLFDGTRTFVRVRLEKRDGSFFAEPVSAAGAGLLSTLAHSDGMISVDSKNMLNEGDEVQVILLRKITQ